MGVIAKMLARAAQPEDGPARSVSFGAGRYIAGEDPEPFDSVSPEVLNQYGPDIGELRVVLEGARARGVRRVADI